MSSSVGSRTGSNSTHSRRPSKCRVTLETLGDRLDPGEAGDLAAQLPEEIGLHFTRSDEAESFGWQEFVDRVAEDEGLSADDRGDAAYYAQVVVDLVAESVSSGELEDVIVQLPEDEFDDLFELVDEDQLPA